MLERHPASALLRLDHDVRGRLAALVELNAPNESGHTKVKADPHIPSAC